MTAGNNAPKERIRIFGRDGQPLGEFRATVERSWAIADEGRAQFSYPTRKTSVVDETLLQFGNWLLVENDSLLPWVGVLDVPREWSTRVVTVYAYGPERVFSWRRGPLEAKLSGSAGTIFESLIGFVNTPETTIIRAGDIWRGGIQRSETVNPTPLNEDLQRLAERSQEEYQWRPVIEAGGRLTVYADWMAKLGQDTGALLHEGKGGGNLEAVGTILTEDGPIANEVFGYGDGETWQSKPAQIVSDLPSIGKYGLRQIGKEFSGVSNLTTLYNNSNTELGQFKQPKRVFQLNALNVGDTFKYMQLGNRLTVRFQNIGFYTGGTGYGTTVRILGLVYDPAQKNKIELTVEEVI